ncbi:MAG: glycosyltransferase family 2 protein [Chloroflexota bacterium]
MLIISLVALLICLVPVGYLMLMALAAIRPILPPPLENRVPTHRFIITIPAHDEANVIEATVRRLKALNYPAQLFSIHIVADHCTDNTAEAARQAGAVVHERNTGPRSGKGAALSWLFERVLSEPDAGDAVVIFDADTRVDPEFLRVMDTRLAQGDQVIQGQHIISNPDQGRFPALTWAMFLVDNRFQNLGRTNLGWSAKHMGDSICFRADILRRVGWGEGLTEDYQLRQKLLLEGIKITYEPAAIGYGEAPLTWAQARAQRARWLRGTHDAGRQYAWRLLVEGLKRRDPALLDGALQAYLPAYSTLTLLVGTILLCKLASNWFIGPVFPESFIVTWIILLLVLLLYPLFGLVLEQAPPKAYLAILSGPAFIVWRTWLALKSRFGTGHMVWTRTAHGEKGGR